jgi:hypothetical protein
MTRQGVTFTLAPGLFPNGLTGIRVIDAYILSINPHGLKEQPSVWSPDLDYPTVTTWTSP